MHHAKSSTLNTGIYRASKLLQRIVLRHHGEHDQVLIVGVLYGVELALCAVMAHAWSKRLFPALNDNLPVPDSTYTISELPAC